MNDILIRIADSPHGRLAIFDYDGTLVKAREGRPFPKDVGDWTYLRASVPGVLRALAVDHQIVIVTDQSKPWKVDQIRLVVADLGCVSTVVIGVKIQKPDTTLFRSVYPTVEVGSFYIGDAAGRAGDWSDKDAQFAENLGLPFRVPESVFPLAASEVRPSLASVTPEVVIMVGYPASGKSTVARSLAGYHIVDGDRLKTAAAMVKDAKAYLWQSVGLWPIVFDCTGGSKKKRAAFVQFAKDHGLSVRVFRLQTSIEDSMERNKERAEHGGPKVPAVAFYTYRKHFEEPTEDEGFTVLKL